MQTSKIYKCAMHTLPLVAFLLSGCYPYGNDVPNETRANAPNSNAPLDHGQPASDQQEMLLHIVELAKKGRIPSLDFSSLQSRMNEVVQKWGSPDKVDQLGTVSYAVYEKHEVTIGYDDSNRITDLRSYAAKLRDIDVSELKKELGEPNQIKEIQGESLYFYKVSEKDGFLLRFIIPSSTGKIDHISLIYTPPKDQEQEPFPLPADEGKPPVENGAYFLPIKGESDKLTKQMKRNMDLWREHILQFATQHPGDVFVNGPNQKKVALTFDDGPDLTVTPDIIKTLDEYGIKASFFFVGNKVQKYPDVARLAFEHGHLVLGHSYLHEDLTTKSTQELDADIKKTAAEIEKVIGKTPALLRPPFGETNENVVERAKVNGQKIVLWSIDTLDWSQKESGNIAKNVLDHVRNGDIILMHSNEGKSETAKALPLIIQELQRQHFEIVDVGTLLGVKAYK